MLHVVMSSLQKVELSFTASVTQCKFLCNLCCFGAARQVAGRLQRVMCTISNLSRNFLGFATMTITQSRNRGHSYLMLLTHVGFTSKIESDTFRSVLIYGKEQESRKKIFHNPAKISSS